MLNEDKQWEYWSCGDYKWPETRVIYHVINNRLQKKKERKRKKEGQREKKIKKYWEKKNKKMESDRVTEKWREKGKMIH